MTMTWEEKFQAIRALDDGFDVALKMRKPGDWYVHTNFEVKNGSILESRYGNGPTPEAAVNDHWERITTEVTLDQYIVVHATSKKDRRAYRWNGFMWSIVTEPEQVAADDAEKRGPTGRLNLLKSLADHGPARVQELDGEIETRVQEILKLSTEKALVELIMRLVKT